MPFLSETDLETALLAQLATLGYTCTSDAQIGPDGAQPERTAYDEVVLQQRFAEAVARLNPGLPAEVRQEAIQAGVANRIAHAAGGEPPRAPPADRGRGCRIPGG